MRARVYVRACFSLPCSCLAVLNVRVCRVCPVHACVRPCQGVWHAARLYCCLQLAAPIGLSPLTLCPFLEPLVSLPGLSLLPYSPFLSLGGFRQPEPSDCPCCTALCCVGGAGELPWAPQHLRYCLPCSPLRCSGTAHGLSSAVGAPQPLTKSIPVRLGPGHKAWADLRVECTMGARRWWEAGL